MAQGEPMVWLTGGALVICIAMILGLLSLVLYCGAITFWPLPLVRLETVDGFVRMGEVTRHETFTLSLDATGNFSEPVKQRADALLAQQPSVQTTRRLLRTGNFKLTGEHFNWISDFEIREAGETRPSWAVTLERLTWGRFYGEPFEFQCKHPRPVDESEAMDQAVSQFFAANRWRLPAEDGETLDAALAELQATHADRRQQNIAAFLDTFSPNQQRQLDVMLGPGETVTFSDVPEGEDVVEVVERWTGPDTTWQRFTTHHPDVIRRFKKRRHLEKHDIGALSDRKIEAARLRLKQSEIDYDVSAIDATGALVALDLEISAMESSRQETRDLATRIKREQAGNKPLIAATVDLLEKIEQDLQQQLDAPRAKRQALETEVAQLPQPVQEQIRAYRDIRQAERLRAEQINEEVDALKSENARYVMTMVTADGEEVPLELSEIVRAFPANQLGLGQKLAIYFSRWREFLMDGPRSANQEGGVFPAIWGTVVMTVIMSLFVVPFGVLAALYLREYAKGGLVISAVRIAINNLAGVPSIVFGVFGLGFFCYTFGAFIDGGPERAGISPWPAPLWFLVLGVLVLVAVLAFFLSIVSMSTRHAAVSRWKRIASRTATGLWLVASVLVIALVVMTPFFDGFYQAHEHNPKFGKGGLLWASLTLALLTLPVVIVATEEALSAVPNSLREGSYACGAGKWQTIARIVLPHAVPGIMTGMILAMARGAGEVAPLMLVGALKFVPELPVDGLFPYIHPDRSFMHLGFHIYDVGFQSQDSEGAKPMVYTTTLLLIGLIATLNVSAVALRGRLKKRFRSGQF